MRDLGDGIRRVNGFGGYDAIVTSGNRGGIAGSVQAGSEVSRT